MNDAGGSRVRGGRLAAHRGAGGRGRGRGRGRRALVAVALLAVACSGAEEEKPAAGTPAPGAREARTVEPPKPAPEPEKSATDDPNALREKGRQAYLSNCIACHNIDPQKDGALGPSIAGSSAELIEARVMRAEYPDGYTPKRDTRAMVAMPFLEKQLPALAAYLSSIERADAR